MTIMFCQECYQVSECKVENPQPMHRSVYFEQPYINAYVRERTCSSCHQKFKTYEIGEASFLTLRKIVEMSKEVGSLIDSTWSDSKNDFFSHAHESGEYNEQLLDQYESELEKMESILPKNVILFPNKGE